jgi:hypothetical protein
MKTNIRTARRIAAACVVATGFAILWVILAKWVSLLGGNLLSHSDSQYEVLQVAADGTPILSTYSSSATGSLLTSRRSLEGKPWPLEYEHFLQSAYFPKPYEPPGIVETPLPWDEGYGRIAGATDGKLIPTAWYLVRDDERTGGVYLAGYDGPSKKCVGYIGRDGFLAAKPSADEQFIVPKIGDIWEGFTYVADGQNLEQRQLVRNTQFFGDDTSAWSINLLEVDRWSKIDLRQRTVRMLAKFHNAIAINWINVNRTTYDQIPVLAGEPSLFPDPKDVEKWKELNAKAEKLVQDDGRPKFSGMSAVREPDRIVVFDVLSTKRKEFLLPEKLHKRRMSVFLLGADQMLIDAHEEFDEFWSGGPIVRLYWINSQGQIQREQELKLAGSKPETIGERAWSASAAVPVSLFWLVGFVLGGPLAVMQANLVSDFGSGAALIASAAWMPLVVVLLVAAALTWLTVRMQRKYHRSATVAWAVFVFLFGAPGFLAYLVEHRRSKLEACGECGEVVPRDRDTCAACDAEFAPPARVGTEIFA